MIFVDTKLKGMCIIGKMEDERGFFARTFYQHEFEAPRRNI